MQTFRNILRSLVDVPRGFSADGRAIGLGLDAAMAAQRKTGAEIHEIRPARRPMADAEVQHSRAS